MDGFNDLPTIFISTYSKDLVMSLSFAGSLWSLENN